MSFYHLEIDLSWQMALCLPNTPKNMILFKSSICQSATVMEVLMVDKDRNPNTLAAVSEKP